MKSMINRRTVSIFTLCGGMLAAASFVPLAHAGNVTWGVSVGGPGFSVSAVNPGFYGGRAFVRAPFHPYARPYFRPVVRGPWLVPARVIFPYVAPAPVAIAPQRVVLAPRPVFFVNRPWVPSPFGGSSY